jgi:hypothetical protein
MSLFSPRIGVWSLEGRSGARYVLCTFPCLEHYLDVLDENGEMEVARIDITPGTSACIYCAGCGHLVAYASRCVLHENGCPEYSWREAVAQAKLFQAAWRLELYEDVPEEAWPLAESIGDREPELPPDAVVALVVGMLDI